MRDEDFVKLEDINLLDIGNSIQICGAIWAGDGYTYLCFFPDEFDETLGNEMKALIMDKEDWKKFLRQTDLMETEVLAKIGDDKNIGKAILRKSSRQISQRISWAVYKRDNYTCRYCGRDDVPLTVDHIVLWEDGGRSIEENLVASCRSCNQARGNMKYVDWLNHPKYNKVAKGLSDEVRLANEELIDTLDNIPIRIHKVSR